MDVLKLLNSIKEKFYLDNIRRGFFVRKKSRQVEDKKVSNTDSYLLDYKKYESDSGIRRKSIVNISLDMRLSLEEGISKNISGLGARLRLEVPDKVDVYFREYMQSDPLSKIDWKAYARNDTLIIRQTKGQAHLKVLFVVDSSSSMRWKVNDEATSKKDLALRLSACMSKLHLEQEDEVNFCNLTEELTNIYKIRSYEDCSELYERSFNSKNPNRDDGESLIKDSKREHHDHMDIRLVPEDRTKYLDDNYSVYDLIYVFSDALDSGYSNFLTEKSIFFHTLSVYELDPRWVKSGTIYYSKYPYISYNGAKILDGRYSQVIEKWMKKIKQNVVKKCEYMLIHEMTGIDEQFLGIGSILKERRNLR